MNQNWTRAIWFALSAAALEGCGAGAESAAAELDADDARLVFDRTAALQFRSGPRQDSSTQCTVNGLSIHCCPGNQPSQNRWAMIGARVDYNIFKCAELTPAVFAPPFIDGPDGSVFTVRAGMHTCPSNAVMVGFHADLNDLLCVPLPWSTTESVDIGTQDSFPMHVCPPGNAPNGAYTGQAMSGIHLDQNLLLCAQ